MNARTYFAGRKWSECCSQASADCLRQRPALQSIFGRFSLAADRTPSVSKGDNGAAWKKAGSTTRVTRTPERDIQTGREAKAQKQSDDGIQISGYTGHAAIYLRGSMNGRATACPAEGSQAGESGKGAKQYPRRQQNLDACERRVAGTIL